jgi:hypothetical protein
VHDTWTVNEIGHSLSTLYTHSYIERFYCLTSYLKEKLSKLSSWTGKGAGLRTVLSSRPSHRELRSSVREFHSFLSLPAHTTMTSPQGTQPQHPFLAIHSTDEHHMIYCFSNTTSYSTFYAFFSPFRITLWPMWPANRKRQPCFYPPQSHAQEDTQNWQKITNLMGNLCFARKHSVQFFVQFFTQLNCRV